MPILSELPNTPPAVERFELIGVNGYKTLILECRHAIKIVAAENGTGKTTLLNALHAVLSLNLSILANMDFFAFKLKLKNAEEIFYFKHELFPHDHPPQTTKSLEILKKEGLSENAIRRAATYIREKGMESFSASSQFLRIYYDSSFTREELISAYRSAVSEQNVPKAAAELVDKVQAALQGVKVLYLPTFRRIETEFADFDTKSKKRNYDRWYPTNEDELEEDQLIWFGMSDVESKLDLFKSRIKNRTSESYSRISAQSLEELLSPSSRRPDQITPENLDFISQIGLVLARLGRSGGETEARISNLIYSGDINHKEYDGLRSHLFQIVSIYAATQAQELAIEGFTNVVNSYWRAATYGPDEKPSKYFDFDKFELSTVVLNAYNDEPLSLNNLSSGEKQIVAVFAKLYLREHSKYIVLIDEPELSLAMTWQRMFLKDILESPSCDQLIAITHSPFIFENELDQYAEPLTVKFKEYTTP